jgi:hypothetical protein
VLENQRLLEGEARLTLIPKGLDVLAQLLASSSKVRQDRIERGES